MLTLPGTVARRDAPTAAGPLGARAVGSGEVQVRAAAPGDRYRDALIYTAAAPPQRLGLTP